MIEDIEPSPLDDRAKAFDRPSEYEDPDEPVENRTLRTTLTTK